MSGNTAKIGVFGTLGAFREITKFGEKGISTKLYYMISLRYLLTMRYHGCLKQSKTLNNSVRFTMQPALEWHKVQSYMFEVKYQDKANKYACGFNPTGNWCAYVVGYPTTAQAFDTLAEAMQWCEVHYATGA